VPVTALLVDDRRMLGRAAARFVAVALVSFGYLAQSKRS
jgi:hypothetical protein